MNTHYWQFEGMDILACDLGSTFGIFKHKKCILTVGYVVNRFFKRSEDYGGQYD
jgi:hypothetical protein